MRRQHALGQRWGQLDRSLREVPGTVEGVGGPQFVPRQPRRIIADVVAEEECQYFHCVKFQSPRTEASYQSVADKVLYKYPKISQIRLSSNPRNFDNFWSIKLKPRRCTSTIYILSMSEVLDISVGASGDGSSSSTFFSRASDLTSWAGDDLLVSFFLRSDSISSPIPVGPWSGESAEADFLNFTVVQGSASVVPEPSSIALLGVGGLAMIRRRRS